MIILYPPAEKIQNDLIQLPPQTLSPITIQRWISWWDKTIPKSPVWKTLVGLVLANIENIFLPIFLMELFLKEYFDFKKSLLNMLEFISPISIPANYPPSDYTLLWNENYTQKMKVLKLKNSPYIERSD
jgi:hypothetical protein